MENKDDYLTCITCIICLDTLEKNYILQKDCKCNINIHKKCFYEWNIKNPNQCPICRLELNKNIIITINPTNLLDTEEIIHGEIIVNNQFNNNRFNGEGISKKKKFVFSLLLSFILFGIVIGVKSLY